MRAASAEGRGQARIGCGLTAWDRWENQVWVLQVQTGPVCEGPLCWQGWRRNQCDGALSQLQGGLLAGVWDQNRLALFER